MYQLYTYLWVRDREIRALFLVNGSRAACRLAYLSGGIGSSYKSRSRRKP